MRLRLATVLSADPWESRLVEECRRTNSVRLVTRAYEPVDLATRPDVIVGSVDTTWFTPAWIQDQRRLGVRVIGVVNEVDRPGRARLERAGVDAIVNSASASQDLLAIIRSVAVAPRHQSDSTTNITLVTGATGSPGRTELACALSWLQGPGTVLIDADPTSPSVALRLGLGPLPNVDAATNSISAGQPLTPSHFQALGDIRILAGSLQGAMADPIVRRDTVHSVNAPNVVVDCGVVQQNDPLLEAATNVVFVVDASPVGIVRAATVLAGWTGSPPSVVLNKMGPQSTDAAEACRYALGLEPSVLLPYLSDIRESSVRGNSPIPELCRRLAPISGALAADQAS